MNITAEVTIDLDEKRKVWSNTSTEITEENFGDAEKRAELMSSLSVAAANGALHSYKQVGGKVAGPRAFQEKAEPVGFQS